MSLKTTNKIDANTYELEIEISADAFEEALQKAYLKTKKNIAVPGFRKGKAPRKVIEKEFGE
ncbi:MAG: trigger factor family protein, partial [Clostridiales bacterium]|nr:trigger factor family protein [Clostridiales bacterium]